MDAEDFASDKRGYGKTVEDVDEGLPDLEITSTLALIVETIDCKGVVSPVK